MSLQYSARTAQMCFLHHLLMDIAAANENNLRDSLAIVHIAVGDISCNVLLKNYRVAEL